MVACSVGPGRDPLVARDLLIGTLVGTAVGLVMGPIRVLLPLALAIPGPPPHAYEPPTSIRAAMAYLLATVVYATVWVLGIVFLLVLTRRVVRREWIAVLVVTLLFTGIYLGAPSPWIVLPLATISVGILVVVTVRFGVLAGIACETVRRTLGYRIYSTDPSSWDFYSGMIAVAAVAALAWWAARTMLAGRPLFGETTEPRLEEA